MTDWGVHLLDMAFYAMDSWHPLSVSANGGKIVYPDDAMETPDVLESIYKFNDFSIIWKNNFALKSDETGRNHGLAFKGINGTLYVNRNGWEVVPNSSGGGDLMEKVSHTLIKKLEHLESTKVVDIQHRLDSVTPCTDALRAE